MFSCYVFVLIVLFYVSFIIMYILLIVEISTKIYVHSILVQQIPIIILFDQVVKHLVDESNSMSFMLCICCCVISHPVK